MDINRNIEQIQAGEQRKPLAETLRDRYLDLMKGKEDLKNFEKIDFTKILPDLNYWLGENFEFKPSDWWKTASILDKKVLYYPRKFARIPKDLPPDLKEKQIKMQEGGLLHEAGHHLGVVRVLEKFILEADTKQRILGDLSLGEVSKNQIRQALKRSKKDIEAVAEKVDLGPYIANLLFLKDLHNVVLDIWLEYYLTAYPEQEFALEAKESLETINQELFQDLPSTLQNELFASQLKRALLLKKMRPDLKEWGESGYDLWFKEGLFSPEVQAALKEIVDKKAFENLTDVEELKEIIMPKSRINWIKRKKLEEAYFIIRGKYIELLLKDFEKKTNEQMVKMPNQQDSGEVGGDQSGGTGENQNGDQSSKPPSFNDLPPEIQEQIINQILDELESEESGTPSLSEEDREEREALDQLGREAIRDEIKNRQETKQEEKPNSSKEESPDKNKRQSIKQQLAAKDYSAQIHAASKMERAKLLKLTPDQLREFENRKRELASQINFLTDFLVDILKNKMEPEVKSHQAMGHLMPGRLPDYIRGVNRGEEPKTFQHLGLVTSFPAIDLLFLVDHSGSMGNLDKNKKAADTVLVFAEAFLRAERELDKLVSSAKKKRDYLREGLITFSDEAVLRKPLDSALDEKTIAQLYFAAENISGGGTADAEALRNLISYLKEESKKYKGRHKILNLAVMITDGQGERDKINDVLQTARNLPNAIFIIIGAGSDTEDVLGNVKRNLPGVKAIAVHIKNEKMNQMAQEIIKKTKEQIEDEVKKL